MGLLDWLKRRSEPAAPAVPSGLSRRDFFASVVGKGPPPEPQPRAPLPNVLHAFFITGFPDYDGPALVPVLRPGIQLQLRRDYDHPTDPTAVKIYWGRDLLGYVPPELSPEVHRMMGDGPPPRVRTRRIDPSAELAEVVELELVR